MAFKEDGQWIFDKKEVDLIFEKAINRPLKRAGSLSESEIMKIADELDVNALSVRNAIMDIKTNSVDDIISGTEDYSRYRSPGGTKGGFKSFILGIGLTIAGGYMLTNQISVRGGFWGNRWNLFGGMRISAFGATLVPLLLGIGMLFFNGKSKVGWTLTGGSALAIFVGIITNLQIHFQQTSLYVTLIMLVCLVGGLGLVARSLKEFQ